MTARRTVGQSFGQPLDTAGRVLLRWQRAAALSIPTTTGSVVAFDTAVEDKYGWGTPGSLATVPSGVDGLYLISARVDWQDIASVGASTQVILRWQGIADYILVGGPATPQATHMAGAMVLGLNAGQQLGLIVFQSSGATKTVTAGLEIALLAKFT